MKIKASLLVCLSIAGLAWTQGPPDWSGWRWYSEFTLGDAGGVRMRIRPEIAARSQFGLRDLRLADDSGREIPFVLEMPRRRASQPRPVARFQVEQIDSTTTRVEFETRTTQTIDAVELETPANNFVKAASVAGHGSGGAWESLAEGRQIFAQGSSRNLKVNLARGSWDRLRVDLNDSPNSTPIPVSGVKIHLSARQDLPLESYPCQLEGRIEMGDWSRLQIRLPYRNVQLFRLDLQTPDRAFNREARLLTRQVEGGRISVKELGRGGLSRAIQGEASISDRVALDVGRRMPNDEILLDIESAASGPLEVVALTAVVVPDYAFFRHSRPGTFRFLFGSPLASGPEYNLESPEDRPTGNTDAPISGEPQENPDHVPSESLPGFAGTAASFDAKGWDFRKKIRVESPGVQSLELDLDVLSSITGSDFRVVRQEKQLAYLFDPEWTVQEVNPVARQEPPEIKAKSLWSLALDGRRLPVASVHCQAPEAVFQRHVVLFEMVQDERGNLRRRELGGTVWIRSPGRGGPLRILPSVRPETDVLFLELDDGDNPPLRLGEFRVQIHIPRLIFKTPSTDDLWLYYGNRRVGAPEYDIRLIGGELLDSPKAVASLANQEALQPSPWLSGKTPAGLAKLLFWGALGLGVVVLLYVISRLLPPSPEGPEE